MKIQGAIETRRVVSGILAVLNVGEFSMQFPSEINCADARLSLLKAIAEKAISLDMINICYDQLNFIVRAHYFDEVERILKTQGIDYTCIQNMAKVSINGVRMKGTPGVMARIYGALESAKVEVIRNTDSHTTISCLINEANLSHALNALKSEFELSNKEITYEGL
jgi:aspartate kinase